MSKPAGSSTQNLDEILASIRKGLAEEAAQGADNARKPPAPGGEPRAAGGGLSSRLAGALNGSAPSGSALDGALAEFFAHVPGRDAAPPAGKSSGAGGETRDPFWFLSRPGAAADARGRKDDKPAAGAPANEEVALSRPETLRPSLPPLFVTDGEPAAPVRSGAGPATAGAAPRVEAPAEARPSVAMPARAAPNPPPAERREDQQRPAAGGAVEIAAAAPAAAAPEAAMPTEPAADAHSAVARNPALEQMIAQLLEPVLMRWLDANLPRMIDGIVRAEVARALNARS